MPLLDHKLDRTQVLFKKGYSVSQIVVVNMPSWFLNVASRRAFSIWKPSDVNQHLTCFLKSTQARTFVLCHLRTIQSQRTFIISGLVDWYIKSKWQLSGACLVRVRGFHSQLQRLSPPKTRRCHDDSGLLWRVCWNYPSSSSATRWS